MLAVLAPGQGSQRAGGLRPWLDDPATNAALARLALPPAVVTAGVDPDADAIDTAVAQPLIVATGLAVAAGLGNLPPGTWLAGHSVGEITAAALAGVLPPATAVRLAAARGQAMARASAATRGGMTALLGGDPAEVAAGIERAGAVVANHNGHGQLVAAGSAAALQALAEDPPAGARLRPLPVAGAFHTDLMAAAVPALAEAVGAVPVADPRHRYLSGVDGAEVTTGAEIGARLVAAVTRPVRWDRCMAALTVHGVTACLELAPAGVLTALVRRHLPHVETLAITSPADLPAARDLLRGDVDSHRDSVEVVLPGGAAVAEWLAGDGDPVREGQPLARFCAGEPAP